MASHDDDRRELFGLLENGLGSRGAALLMSYLPPLGWADLATKQDVVGLRAELESDMAELKTELKTEIAGLRVDFERRMSGLTARLWAANVATMIGLAGLVFAVASFAQ